MRRTTAVLILIITILLSILTVLTTGKIFYYNYYHVDTFQESVENISYTETWNLKARTDIEDYFAVREYMLKNDFEDYEKLYGLNQDNAEVYILYDENKNIVSQISFAKNTQNYVQYLMDGMTLYTNSATPIKSSDVESFIKTNNIKNDKELVDYIIKFKQKNFNIYTNKSDMKTTVIIRYIINGVYPNMSLIEIKGDYQGILYEKDRKTKVLNIFYNDKKYTITFTGENFTYEYIKKIIPTLKIREEY